jgi:hypothetical protein
MAEVSESLKERIRKLLAKGNNTACTVEEARAFNDKAYELMAKHNLERADVAAKEEAIRRTHMELQVLKRPWSSYILHGLCHLYLCKWVFTRSGGRGPDTITIIGEESNVAVCHAVAVAILRAVQQEAKRHAGGRSFMTGAGDAIWRRCYEMRPQTSLAAPKETTGRALMVLEEQDKVGNQEYSDKLFGKLRPGRKSSPKIKSAEKLAAGQRFGNSVNLRGNLLGNG